MSKSIRQLELVGPCSVDGDERDSTVDELSNEISAYHDVIVKCCWQSK